MWAIGTDDPCEIPCHWTWLGAGQYLVPDHRCGSNVWATVDAAPATTPGNTAIWAASPSTPSHPTPAGGADGGGLHEPVGARPEREISHQTRPSPAADRPNVAYGAYAGCGNRRAL